MNLFYGIGMGRGYAIPRLLLGLDFTVILSVANVAALVWHARILSREARRIAPLVAHGLGPGAQRPAPIPDP
jgi:hypothetical protein